MKKLGCGLLVVAGLVDLLFIAASISMIVDPEEGSTRGAGVGALVLVLLINGLLFLVLWALYRVGKRIEARETPEEKEARAAAEEARRIEVAAKRRQRQIAKEERANERKRARSDKKIAERDAKRTAAWGDDGVPRRSRTESFAPPRVAGDGRQGAGRMVGGDWVPSPPHGELLDPWGRGASWSDINGVWYHREALRRFLSPLPEFSDFGSGARLNEPIVLTYDGDNPFSSTGHAVAAFLRGQHIGYLPDDETPTWGPILRDLHAEGFDLRVPGNIWGHDAEYGEHYSARVNLPDPRLLTPSNGLPSEPHVVIPAGRKRQVTKEEDHLDVLTKYVKSNGPNPVAAVLRSITEVRPRSTYEAVQVEIDGHRVGILSDVQSKNMLPLVKYIEARGKLAVCRAEVQGTAIKADVVLYCADAGEVGADWLAALGPELPKPTEVIPGPDWDWDDDDTTPTPV